MADTISLPDNLIGRLTRINVANKSFTNDKGENIEFSRLVLRGTVKGKDFAIETKIEQKDITFLSLADTEEERRAIGIMTDNQE